tara:strand:+ start:204 stop:848 length:645 start_codon:yes stop_codon:yes gene_type:complete
MNENNYNGEKTFIKNMNPKKYGIYKMTRYSELERRINLKERFETELDFHNNCYEQIINTKYSNIISLNRNDHTEMVVGYLIYNDNIIPYTETMALHTIYNVLKNDEQFKFAGEQDDMNYQYLICFLTSVGVLFPKDKNGNLLFEVISLFNGCCSNKYLIEYTKLTHFITGKTTHYGTTSYDFDYADFNTINVIKPTSPQNKIILKTKTIKEALR